MNRRMQSRAPLLLLLVMLAVTTAVGDAHAQAAAAPEQAPAIDPKQELPLDPDVTAGALPNGLRYYIRQNGRPENRAELRLVVNAGSVLEDEDQLGLAHFVEHMAFNGTKNFTGQELVDYLESIGMRFGPDLNAYTSFDETVYILTVPTDSAGVLETAFQILEDWAHGQVFDRAEVDKERGVVIEEWRGRRGAGARMRDRQFPIIYEGSRYAERLPIGRREVLEAFDPAALERFYADWYRPDLMAVIAVGDFDPEVIERLIRDHFAGLEPRAQPRERAAHPVPDHEGTRFAIATDPEATNSSVGVLYKHPPFERSTLGAYRESMVARLFTGMLNARLAELTQKPDPPFLGAGTGRGGLGRLKSSYSLSAVVRDGGITAGLEALLVEAERVARHGFTPTELDRARTNVLRGLERAHAERDKTNSGVYASDYIQHFLTGDPATGIDYAYEMHRKLLPGITLEEVDRLAREWITEGNRVVVASAPEKEGVAAPAEAELLAVFDAVKGREILAYADVVSDEPLIAETPAPAPIVSEGGVPEVGLIEWRLANGVRVLLKPTDFKEDEVLMRAYSPGGTSLAPDSTYVAAVTAATVVATGGVGPFDRVELRKKLAGKAVSASVGISSLEEGLSGSASPRDLETLLQLVHLYFTSPREDSAAFMSYRQRAKAAVANRSGSPEATFSDTLRATLTQYHFRARPFTSEVYDEMDLGKSLAFYRDRFADAGDFTFIFVGSFDPQAIRPLIQSYLGSLPSIGRQESWRNEGIRPPDGVVRKAVYRGIEEKGRTHIQFGGPLEYSRRETYVLSSMAEILELRLRERLREDLGGTYGVSVSGGGAPRPEPRYSVSISFGAAPDRLEELTAEVWAEIEALKTDGPSEEDVLKIKEIQRRGWERGLKENAYWIGQIGSADRYGHDLRETLTYDAEYIEGLTAEAIRAAAERYLREDAYVQVSLYPESYTKTQ